MLTRLLRAIFPGGPRRPLRERRERLRPVRRSRLGAFWQARASVRAGIGLDEFLRARLARYLARIPAARGELPLRIEIAGGEIGASPAPPTRSPPACGSTEDRRAPLVALEGPSARQELPELEARLAALTAEIATARGRADELSRRLDDDVAAGGLAAKASIEVTAEQLGRPPIRSAAPRNAALAFAAAALAAESWQVAVPLARGAGLDPARIADEALRRPADVAFLSLFALGVAAGIFALAHAALGAALALLRDDLHDERRRRLASGALAAGLLATLVAAAVAALRAAGADAPSGVELVLLLVAVPLASSLALRAARHSDRQRARERRAALEWDRERAAAIADRVRRDEALASAEDGLRALERERELARQRLRDLARRASMAARAQADAERRDRAELARLAHSIVEALELDRYELIRQASSRHAAERAEPEQANVAEQRPPAVEAVPARPATELEKGRLAS